MSDLYTEFTQNLPLPGAMENINERRVVDMAYSNKAKTAEANADQKKDFISLDDIEVVRAAEVKEDRVLFDIKVKGISISNMVLQHYIKDGKEGDIIDFPQYKAKNGKYYSYAWFPISKETREGLVSKVVDALG